jgi:hypothetical protein
MKGCILANSTYSGSFRALSLFLGKEYIVELAGLEIAATFKPQFMESELDSLGQK